MLNSAPHKWTINEIAEMYRTGNGTWAGGMLDSRHPEPARVYGMFTLQSRIKLAWAVFTGEADALFFPNQTPPKAY